MALAVLHRWPEGYMTQKTDPFDYVDGSKCTEQVKCPDE